ncbi:hypothetical protein GPALN_006020 [Globodera pallida]|nr:hypothetical protein GPALN_006020 [Globodera pallida]
MSKPRNTKLSKLGGERGGNSVPCRGTAEKSEKGRQKIAFKFDHDGNNNNDNVVNNCNPTEKSSKNSTAEDEAAAPVDEPAPPLEGRADCARDACAFGSGQQSGHDYSSEREAPGGSNFVIFGTPSAQCQKPVVVGRSSRRGAVEPLNYNYIFLGGNCAGGQPPDNGRGMLFVVQQHVSFDVGRLALEVLVGVAGSAGAFVCGCAIFAAAIWRRFRCPMNGAI